MRSMYRFQFSKGFPSAFLFKFEDDFNYSLKQRAIDELSQWNKRFRIPKVISTSRYDVNTYKYT